MHGLRVFSCEEINLGEDIEDVAHLVTRMIRGGIAMLEYIQVREDIRHIEHAIAPTGNAGFVAPTV